MWYLTSENDERIIYVVPQKPVVVIGRSPDPAICDFAMQDDPSISRKHSVLSLVEGRLCIKDLGSRYGTYVNDPAGKVENSSNVELKKNDHVKFGKMNCEWIVNEAKFVTCTSTLKGESLSILKNALSKIGGTLKNVWDDTCEYLTMPAITLTIKVVLALVQGSHIVTTEFWNKCLIAIDANSPLPDPRKFTPQISETTINKDAVSFLPDIKRAKLFTGKKFIFFSKRQFEMYETVLLKSCAYPVLLSASGFTKTMLCEDDVVVVHCNITTTSQETEVDKEEFSDIINYLKSKGKRLIPDAEIGLAILYVSTGKYCNTNFNFPSEVIKQSVTPESKVLAQETEEQLQSSKKENLVINESLTSVSGVNSKRKFRELDDNTEIHSNKKAAFNVEAIANETYKRKLNETDEVLENQSKKFASGDLVEEDNLFNFETPNANKPPEKLQLTKPIKRKAENNSHEEDLFKFIQNNDDCTSLNSRSENDNGNHISKKMKGETSVENISAMRGIKLEELKNSGILCHKPQLKPITVKKEYEDDLDSKMNSLDLGAVVITINDSLIVKKEPIEIIDLNSSVKNFKKFKKVWPVNMQVSIITKTSNVPMTLHSDSQNSSVY